MSENEKTMSENNKNLNLGEPLSEEQLDGVSGGKNNNGRQEGNAHDPLHSIYCWFEADGETQADGSTRCKAQCKGNFLNDNPVPDWFVGVWYICRCWGSSSCVSRWHKPCGNPPVDKNVKCR